MKDSSNRRRNVDAFSILRKPIRFREIVQTVRQAMQLTYGWTNDDQVAFG